MSVCPGTVVPWHLELHLAQGASSKCLQKEGEGREAAHLPRFGSRWLLQPSTCPGEEEAQGGSRQAEEVAEGRRAGLEEQSLLSTECEPSCITESADGCRVSAPHQDLSLR